MIRFGCILSFCLMCSAFSKDFQFPPDIEQCEYSDGCCLGRVSTNILRKYHKGHAGLNLPPFEPLHAGCMVLKRIPGGLVDAKFVFKDVKIVGLSEGIIANITGFTKEASNLTFVLDQIYPKFFLDAQYSAVGSIFHQRINGHGESRLAFNGLRVIAMVSCTTQKREGRTYLNVDEVEVDLQPTKVSFNYQNIYNGDKEQSERLNQLLNMHWKQVFSDWKPLLEKALGDIGRPNLNRVFTGIPYDALFLKSH